MDFWYLATVLFWSSARAKYAILAMNFTFIKTWIFFTLIYTRFVNLLWSFNSMRHKWRQPVARITFFAGESLFSRDTGLKLATRRNLLNCTSLEKLRDEVFNHLLIILCKVNPDSGIPIQKNFYLWKTESWTLESVIQHKEPLSRRCVTERGARTGLFIHCLFFIYARKFYVRSQVVSSKIRRDWYTIYYSGTFITGDFLGYPRNLRVQPSLIAPRREGRFGIRKRGLRIHGCIPYGIRRLVPAMANDKRWP